MLKSTNVTFRTLIMLSSLRATAKLRGVFNTRLTSSLSGKGADSKDCAHDIRNNDEHGSIQLQDEQTILSHGTFYRNLAYAHQIDKCELDQNVNNDTSTADCNDINQCRIDNDYVRASQEEQCALNLGSTTYPNVPDPSNIATGVHYSWLNTQANDSSRRAKYVSGGIIATHPTRQLSGTNNKPSKQVQLAIWMDNCKRFNLGCCEDGLDRLEKGTATIESLVEEQKLLMTNVSNFWSSSQGVQNDCGKRWLDQPNPQGIQGDDTAKFTAWLATCRQLGLTGCESAAEAYRQGKISLDELFSDQEQQVREIVNNYKSKLLETQGQN